MTGRRTLGLFTLVVGLALGAALGAPGSAVAATCTTGSPVLTVRSVPVLKGVRLKLDGRPFKTDGRGVATIFAGSCGTHTLSVLPPRRAASGQRARFGRWDDSVFTPSRTVEIHGPTERQVGFEVDYRVTETFVDRRGHVVPISRVSKIVQSNSLGSREEFAPGKPQWLAGTRLIRRTFGLQPTSILYSIRAVMLGGTSVVREAQQRFYPRRTRHFKIRLLLYSMRIQSNDRLFGFPIGSGFELKYPDGHVRKVKFQDGARVFVHSLPRGTYDVTIKAPGLKSTVPIALTRDQTATLKVVSYLDLVVFFGSLLSGALLLLLIRRPKLRARLHPRVLLHRGSRASISALVIALSVTLLTHAPTAKAGGGPQQAAREPVPVLAYYYQWFTQGSWRRAKTDYPILGRYSSDDVKVMRQHVAWSKDAGISGFLVSWKSTPVLNSRLRKLVQVARDEHFKLGIIYEGLDFAREPLPAFKVRSDLRYFARTYGANPVFDMFGKPLVIWSGTWRFSTQEIASVGHAVRPHMLLLASEKNVPDFRRIAGLVDGDAYYWSSVNPATFSGYPDKLVAMGAAVHDWDELWIAPAAPGFDARLLGGTTVVPRDDGKTLRTEIDGALQSSPDALGLISWNEFSENSHVEPSVNNGSESLKVLADTLGTKFTARTDFDSSDPPAANSGYALPLIVGVGFIVLALLAAAFWRRELRNAQHP
jgi:hypothetical protein